MRAADLMAVLVAGMNADDAVAIIDEVDEHEVGVEMADGSTFAVQIVVP